MPRKHKPRKPIASTDELWIAPRHANAPELKAFEPAGMARSNRYLEFADIALGTNEPSRQKGKNRSRQRPAPQYQTSKGKVTSIDSARSSNQGFGAFRNSR